MFDHLRKNRKKSIFYILRDVAQLVARLLWSMQAAGTPPRAKTRSARKAKPRKALQSLRKRPCKHWLFRVFVFSKKHGQNVLTTDLTTYGKWPKNRIFFTLRGVAQLVARDVWDVDAAGSNPVTPTKNQPKTSLFRLVFGWFLYIFRKISCFQLTTCSPCFLIHIGFFHGFFSTLLKSLFFDYSDEDIAFWYRKRWAFLPTALTVL